MGREVRDYCRNPTILKHEAGSDTCFYNDKEKAVSIEAAIKSIQVIKYVLIRPK